MEVRAEGADGEMLLGEAVGGLGSGACAEQSEVECPACSLGGSDSGVHGSEQTH